MRTVIVVRSEASIFKRYKARLLQLCFLCFAGHVAGCLVVAVLKVAQGKHWGCCCSGIDVRDEADENWIAPTAADPKRFWSGAGGSKVSSQYQTGPEIGL